MTLPVAVIFTEIEASNLPYTLINQLEEMGIHDVYFLLDKNEYAKVMTQKYTIFTDDKAKTPMEHLISYHPSSLLRLHFINTNESSSLEKKLEEYLEKQQTTFALNIFLSNQAFPWSTLHSTLFSQQKSLHEFKIFDHTFFKKTKWDDKTFLSQKFNAEEIAFINEEKNPSVFYQSGKADISNFQWLFNSFVHAAILKISTMTDEEKIKSYEEKLGNLIQSYHKNLDKLEKAEKNFNETHYEIYNQMNDSKKMQSKHQRNKEILSQIEQKFPEIIRNVFEVFNQLQREMSPSSSPTSGRK